MKYLESVISFEAILHNSDDRAWALVGEQFR